MLPSSREELRNTSPVSDEIIVSKLGLYQKSPKKKLKILRTKKEYFDLSSFFVKNVFARATGFRTSLSRNDSSNSTLEFLFFHPQLFSNCFCFNKFCEYFEFFCSPTTSPVSRAAVSNKSFFCSVDYMVFNKGNCSSPKSLCKSTKTSSTLFCMSTKNVKISWNLSKQFSIRTIPRSFLRSRFHSSSRVM